MNKRYFRITYGIPNYRGARIATVAVLDDGSTTKEMSNIAINKLYKHLGKEVKILNCNKLPSNYKEKDADIID